MENNEDKIMGSGIKKAPYDDDDVTTRKQKERIPVWVNKSELELVDFTLEITDTITEDLIINVVYLDPFHVFQDEWKDEVEYFIRQNYSNIQDITFWL